MSDIHYFQRYHSKENVHTANAFLLINRLYQYKPQYFYQFLDMLTEDEPLEYQFRLNMTLQERSDSKKGSTIPDAMIVQHGYRLCVEIKIGDCFHADQIKGHLEAFNKLDTKYKLLLSLSNVDECGIAPEIKGLVDEFNKVNNLYNEERLIYRHLTFEKLIEMMECILSERDYEFVDILNDYKEYCTEQGLIDDRYQLMKAYAVGATIEINKKLNLYYRTATDNVKADILGMYKDKEIVAIGKIYKVVKAFMPEDELLLPDGEALSKDEKDRIIEAIMDAQNYGYDLRNVETKFYLVENFEKCSFKKKSKWGLCGGRNFKLETDYGIADIKNKTIKEIAEELSTKTWE